ncbi:unnamed protein product [Mytilus coruscus]|uniref:DUF5641 domain-containing protein n=1 Tax=Mytilus coruscus TaxID=42192 RepID=A0A6J8BGU5_MYTCO|nr:unnamed protein product [Mytilus coruscus]
MSEDLIQRWDYWRKDVFNLKTLEIQRCVKPNGFGKVATCELHFSDASTTGYGQCSYLRLISEDGQVNYSLVMSKSRVVPRKSLTIPRLELSAAVVSSCLETLWFNGPPLLWTNESILPDQSKPKLNLQDLEVSRAKTLITQTEKCISAILERIEYFSDWLRAKKAVAICLNLKDALRTKSSKTNTLSVSVEDMNRAELEIIRHVQKDAFKDEIEKLRSIWSTDSESDRKYAKMRNVTVKQTSLYRLDPIVDLDGIIRVGGRIKLKEGRKELKRYGVLFTCLSSRAVHIETADLLDTSSYINALRSFIFVRGPVRHLRSDQGSNFIGGKRELRKAFSEIDTERTRQYLLDNDCDYIEFKMHVPSASHMGGVWERQIRSIRNVLATLLNQLGTQLDDESLRTFMCEAASIVNSRPLNVESLNDPLLAEPITPNHLLTMKSRIILPPPGEFQTNDVYSKKRWRRVQYLANQFWDRWRKEFQSNLQSRQKWVS